MIATSIIFESQSWKGDSLKGSRHARKMVFIIKI